MTIIAHCGGEFVAREELDLVETPPVNRETGWTPIPHAALFGQVTGSLTNVGFMVDEEQHVLNKDGMEYFGLISVRHNNEYSLLVGIRNSHIKTFSAKLACGSRLFICDNLAFSGEITLSRKHTRYINRDLPHLTMKAIGKLGSLHKGQDARFDAYKRRELASSEADHLIIQMLRNRIITTQQVQHVVKEWDAPSYPEFVEAGPTAWRLFNAVTEASKKRFLSAPNATIALHGMMDSVCEAEFKEAA